MITAPDGLPHASGNDLLACVPGLRRYATVLAGGDIADDLVKECLTRAIANLSQFEPGTNLRAWLSVILRNYYLNEYVRPSGRIRLWRSDEEEAVGAPVAPASQLGTVALNELWQALMSLPDEQREALLLVGVEGLKYEEAAEILDIPVGTVRSRISRARARLLRMWDGKASSPQINHSSGR